MTIPRDKLLHLAVGAVVALLTFGLWNLLVLVQPAHPVAVGLVVTAFIVGAAKEATDRLDNLLMYRRGLVAMHGVEWLDLVATTAGGVVAALVLVRLGWA